MIFAWKRFAVEGAILAGALILQQTLVRWIAFGPIRPDLTLLVLTAVALRHGPIAGLYAGLALGLLQDVYVVDTPGANVLAKCLIGYALGFFEDKVVKSMPAMRVLLLGAAFLAHDAVFYLSTGLRGGVFWNALYRQTAPAAVYTLLLGVAFFYSAARFKSREE